MGLQPPFPWAKEEPGTLDLLKMDKSFSKKSLKFLCISVCLIFSDMETERTQCAHMRWGRGSGRE